MDNSNIFTDYPKEIILKDGTGLTLRPLQPGDEIPLFQMYKDLPEDDRWFTDGDVSNFRFVENWVKGSNPERITTLVAVLEGRIISNAVLLRKIPGPMAHIGKVRISVVPSFREKNLGTWVLFDLMNMAIALRLEILVMELVENRDTAVIRGAKRLDFFQEALLRNYVKDAQGNFCNLVIMVKRLYLGWEYEGGLTLNNPFLKE